MFVFRRQNSPLNRWPSSIPPHFDIDASTSKETLRKCARGRKRRRPHMRLYGSTRKRSTRAKKKGRPQVTTSKLTKPTPRAMTAPWWREVPSTKAVVAMRIKNEASRPPWPPQRPTEPCCQHYKISTTISKNTATSLTIYSDFTLVCMRLCRTRRTRCVSCARVV